MIYRTVEDLKENKKLDKYVETLLKWNKNINLIGKSTESDVWNRHILDSAQIMNLLTENDLNCSRCVDLGSGSGLPGVVLSILGVKNMILVEKSPLKCNFLKEVAKISHNNVEIINDVVENIEGRKFGVIISRALADLSKLLEYAMKLLEDDGKCIFLKGKKLDEEMEKAEKMFDFECEFKKSLTSDEGRIVVVRRIKMR